MPHNLIFIHGMGEGSSIAEYRMLFDAIETAYNDRTNSNIFKNKFALQGVEWQSVTLHPEKTIYETAFATKANNGRKNAIDILVDPIRTLRYFMTFFAGDIIAYTAENDNGIRNKVWAEMYPIITNDEPYSIIAHSLGSVIAFDYLYKLFDKSEPLYDTPGLTAEQMENCKTSFRHFVTMGSPIGLFLLRQGKLWSGTNPAFSTVVNPVQNQDGIERQWLNFYDKQDIVAYPLQDIMKRNQQNIALPIDICVDTGDLIMNSHTGYWSNMEVADDIAAIFSR